MWDLRNGSRILGLPSPDLSCGANIGCPDVFHVSLSDDGHVMATGDGEGLAHVWDLDSGREVMTASTHAGPRILAGSVGADVSPIVALSPDGRLLATVGSDRFLRMWEISTGAQVWALTPERTDTPFVPQFNPLFSPDGTRLLVCSWPAAPRVVDVATGETMVSPSDGPGCGLPFSADGSRIAFAVIRGAQPFCQPARSASRSGTCRSERGSQRLRLSRSARAPPLLARGRSVPMGAFSPWSGVSNRTSVLLRDADTLAPLDTLEHRVRVFQVTFSLDGTRIVTSSDDGAARVWNAQTGKLIFTSLDETSDLKELRSARTGRGSRWATPMEGFSCTQSPSMTCSRSRRAVSRARSRTPSAARTSMFQLAPRERFGQEMRGSTRASTATHPSIEQITGFASRASR